MAKTVNQEYVLAVLDRPGCDKERKILADVYDDAEQLGGYVLRMDGYWDVDGNGVIRWVTGVERFKFLVRSHEAPSVKCATCGSKVGLGYFLGEWSCLGTHSLPYPQTLPGKDGGG